MPPPSIAALKLAQFTIWLFSRFIYFYFDKKKAKKYVYLKKKA